MLRPPDTHYTDSAGVNIAYQVVGDGPVDLVHVPGWVSHVELAWELPELVRHGLAAHRSAFVNETLSRLNPYYFPAPNRDGPSLEVAGMIDPSTGE